MSSDALFFASFGLGAACAGAVFGLFWLRPQSSSVMSVALICAGVAGIGAEAFIYLVATIDDALATAPAVPMQQQIPGPSWLNFLVLGLVIGAIAALAVLRRGRETTSKEAMKLHRRETLPAVQKENLPDQKNRFSDWK